MARGGISRYTKLVKLRGALNGSYFTAEGGHPANVLYLVWLEMTTIFIARPS